MFINMQCQQVSDKVAFCCLSVLQAYGAWWRIEIVWSTCTVLIFEWSPITLYQLLPVGFSQSCVSSQAMLSSCSNTAFTDFVLLIVSFKFKSANYHLTMYGRPAFSNTDFYGFYFRFYSFEKALFSKYFGWQVWNPYSVTSYLNYV